MVIRARWWKARLNAVIDLSPLGFCRSVGSSLRSPTGVRGYQARTHACWVVITSAVVLLIGSRRQSRPALWMSKTSTGESSPSRARQSNARPAISSGRRPVSMASSIAARLGAEVSSCR